MEDFAFTDFTFSTGVIQVLFGFALLLFARAWWRLQSEGKKEIGYMVRITGGLLIVLIGLLLITPRSDLLTYAFVVVVPALISWAIVRKGLPEVSKQIVILSALAALGIATAITVTVEYYSREEFSFGGILMLMSGLSMAGGWAVASASLWLIVRKRINESWGAITFPFQNILNTVWLGGIFLAVLLFIFNPVNSSVIYVIKSLALIAGFLFMLPFSSIHSSTLTYMLAAVVGFCVAATGYVLKQPLGIALGMVTFGAGLRATMIRGEEHGFAIAEILGQLFGPTKPGVNKKAKQAPTTG